MTTTQYAINTCLYVITKGPRVGEMCGKKCTRGAVCDVHMADRKNMTKCCHLLTTGNRNGQECGVSVTGKSTSDTLCTRHAYQLDTFAPVFSYDPMWR
jgi:hypothetical protein